MAWKFLNIGKANAEVDRLALEVASVTKERDDLRANMETNASDVTKQAEELQGQVAALTIERDTAQAALVTAKAELATASDKLANPSAQIVHIASAQAAAITSAQGQPPIASTPVSTPAGDVAASSVEGLNAQLDAIKDPGARTAFWRKNKQAILSASRSQRA